jgi:hypothetical protein
MANKAAIAIGLGAAAAAVAALAGGGVARAEEVPKPKPKATTIPARVTLAKRFGKLFGVPVSLILSTIYAQSGNNPRAQRDNKRGGSWGYGQMTLATATEIYPRVKGKLGKTWDGTGQGLLDPTINIGLTAYYLSLWWKRYKANPRNWMLTAYAYVLGPGRVRAVVPNDAKGKPPKPLPSDFARTKARFVSALKQADVQRALAEDLIKPNLSGLGAALVGKELSKTISAKTTGYQARNMFGLMTRQLSNAYGTLRSYDPTGLAKATRIDAGSIDAARKYLDSTNAMLSKYYAQMPESAAVLTSDQLAKLKTAVSTSSVAVKTVDDLFGTSFWKEFGAEIVQAAKTVASKVSTGIGFSAGMIAAGAVGVGFLILAIKK